MILQVVTRQGSRGALSGGSFVKVGSFSYVNCPPIEVALAIAGGIEPFAAGEKIEC